MPKEYIVHGTNSDNLLQIIEQGYIDPKPKKKNIYMLHNKHPKQIFTQFIYYNIPNQKKQFPFWSQCCIVLHKKIIKKLPFYSTGIGGFSNKFSDGLISNNTIISGVGKLDKLPKVTKLKRHINNYMTKNDIGPVTFMHSHEILFNKKIMLNKYCKCIILYKNSNNLFRLESLCKELNIPIKYTASYGINKIIDLIEEYN